jgi:hypothetical protein
MSETPPELPSWEALRLELKRLLPAERHSLFEFHILVYDPRAHQEITANTFEDTSELSEVLRRLLARLESGEHEAQRAVVSVHPRSPDGD